MLPFTAVDIKNNWKNSKFQMTLRKVKKKMFKKVPVDIFSDKE